MQAQSGRTNLLLWGLAFDELKSIGMMNDSIMGIRVGRAGWGKKDLGTAYISMKKTLDPVEY